ncbi:hypothetical protein C3B51_04285 [Pseudoalteromonas rubra]|uniref:Lipoprotein n=1 Tax=Pseudoalteromonas rubra TaxID=43658 RepID=A0A4Q7EQR4_9GAMM|nr:hypothetical protein [Pseudoalteromonas rubra]RZM84335.1 hypothetical protein C3B51_04285 [Pseudoalteromonas rubra]
MKIGFVPFAAVLLMIGCATPYKKNGVGGGYDDWDLGGGVHRVAFHGNGHSTPEQVNKYWHRRAAELCVSGYEVIELSTHSNELSISGEHSSSLSSAHDVTVPIQIGKIKCRE